MDDATTAYSTFWEQHSPAAAHPLHTPIVAEGPRLLVLSCPECSLQHRGNFWKSGCGEAVRSWMGATPSEIAAREFVDHLPLSSTPGRDLASLDASRLLADFPHARLILLLGEPAHQIILRDERKTSLEETVQAYDEFLPFFPLPDPHAVGPEWYDGNPWFESTILQLLKRCVAIALEKVWL